MGAIAVLITVPLAIAAVGCGLAWLRRSEETAAALERHDIRAFRKQMWGR